MHVINCYPIEDSTLLETETEYEDNMVKENIITEYNINKLLKLFDKSDIEEGNDIEMYIGKTRYSISNFENQRKNKHKNITSINFIN